MRRPRTGTTRRHGTLVLGGPRAWARSLVGAAVLAAIHLALSPVASAGSRPASREGCVRQIHANLRADSDSGATYWSTQRKGANWFNRVPTREWLVAAKSSGIEVVRLAPNKWKSAKRDFLIGDADRYEGLVEEDLRKLREVLDHAASVGIKVVLTTLSLPGARWRQQNDNRLDLRLWKDDAFQSQAAVFWRDLARKLAGHPAIAGYNILNEPTPERTTPGVGGSAPQLEAWYARVKGTPADLNRFYARVVAAIREVDRETPVIVDTGQWASPAAIAYLAPIADKRVLYSVHMYEIYEFTSQQPMNREASYPGTVWREQGDEKVKTTLDAAELERILAPVADWQKRHGIPSDRIFVGEFGCRRRANGAATYLDDLIHIFDRRGWHWAFYAFREDVWDAMDYELGAGPVDAAYWEAIERGDTPTPKRGANPIWTAIRRGLTSGRQ
jgi:endoglucanase